MPSLVSYLDRASKNLGWKLVPTNDYGSMTLDILVHGQKLETEKHFKYLGVIINDEGSSPEILVGTAHHFHAVQDHVPAYTGILFLPLCKRDS